jgi:hypothetical protein
MLSRESDYTKYTKVSIIYVNMHTYIQHSWELCTTICGQSEMETIRASMEQLLFLWRQTTEEVQILGRVSGTLGN